MRPRDDCLAVQLLRAMLLPAQPHVREKQGEGFHDRGLHRASLRRRRAAKSGSASASTCRLITSRDHVPPTPGFGAIPSAICRSSVRIEQRYTTEEWARLDSMEKAIMIAQKRISNAIQNIQSEAEMRKMKQEQRKK